MATLLAGIARTGTAAEIAGSARSGVLDFMSDLPNNLTFIAGNGVTRTLSSDNVTNFDAVKWLNIRPGGSGLGLENLHFKDVTAEYTFTYDPSPNTLNTGAGGVTNGLIGSYSGNTGDIGMGDILGNEFSNITVNMYGYRDTHYLAGGGIVGLRATGESGATSASTFMGKIDGNVFTGVTVTAGRSSDAPTTSAGQSAYIEGGGIIGLDAVSSPSTKTGLASVEALTSNLFTNIKVSSGDVILGGGLVGLNNNSKATDNVSKVAVLLEKASGNVFGKGIDPNTDDYDISVSSVYSLRGGGVIGLNGLSTAPVWLDELSGNVFNGVKVEVGTSYLKGGGLVGLNTNDTNPDRRPVDENGNLIEPDEDHPAAAMLGSASGNLFLDSRVDIDTYLYGGGIVGVRSNVGWALLGQVENGGLQGGLTDNVFQGLTVKIGKNNTDGNSLKGGGIVGVSSEQDGGMTIVHHNWFDALTVSTTGHLYGGGIVGVESNGQSATSAAVINKVTNNTFSGLKVTSSGEIRGGGVIGVRSPNGAAGFANVSDNEFRDSTVSSASSLSGGGIVGASSGAANSFVVLDEVTGNTFSKLNVTTSGSGAIGGGGVIGADGGTSSLNNVENNHFYSLAVTSTSSLSGGGIVGARANQGNATLESLAGNTFNIFSGTEFKVGATDIAGGGIVGLYSAGGASTLRNVQDNTFQGLEVEGSSLSGGGIVGVSSGEQGYIASVRDNLFDQLTFSSSGLLKGGGILGAHANNDSAPNTDTAMSNFAVIRDVWGNDFYNIETTADAIQGGGVIGVWNSGGANGLQRIDNNHFWRLSVESKSSLSGGGVVGVWADNGYAVLDTLSNSTFYGYKMGSDGLRADDVRAKEYIEGGGIVGVRSDNAGYIGTIDNTWFAGLKVTAGTYIDGGGIVGATGPVNNTGNLSIGIHNIVDSVFVNNMITAEDGPIMGGLVYSYGLAGGLTITDSWFMDNAFFSKVTSSNYTDAKVYGAVTVDTGVAKQSGDPYTLTLKATSDGSTVFLGNVICEGSASPDCNGGKIRTNSLYFGTIPSLTGLKSDGSLSATSDQAEANAKLVIDTAPGGAVALYDPIRVNQDNGKTFDMTVRGGGDFEWAGENVFEVAAPGTIDIKSGTTTLASNALARMGIDPFTLIAPKHSFNLATGARMNVQGNNEMTLASADLKGTLFFNLYHTNVNQQGNALLKLHMPTEEEGTARIEGSVVQLSNFKAGERLLGGGDRFYLIATDKAGDLSGDPINNRAYVRQGLLIGYNFIIDKQPNPASGSSEGENQYLVARLEEQGAAVGDPVYVEFITDGRPAARRDQGTGG
jgi:hypothetical protein